LLHPIDAGHQQGLAAGVTFENPIGHPVLDELGFGGATVSWSNIWFHHVVFN
jgi:hypothetical protein